MSLHKANGDYDSYAADDALHSAIRSGDYADTLKKAAEALGPSKEEKLIAEITAKGMDADNWDLGNYYATQLEHLTGDYTYNKNPRYAKLIKDGYYSILKHLQELDEAEKSAADNVHNVDVDDDGDEDIVIENKEDDMPDTEVSDERCKDIRKKRIDKFKGNWGETDEMKRQKKSKTAKADDDDKETVDVSGIAAAIRRGPGSAYEV